MIGTLQLLRKKLKALRRNSATSPSSVRGTWSCRDRKVLVGLLGSGHRCSTEENRRLEARLVENQPLTESWPSTKLTNRIVKLPLFSLQRHLPPTLWGVFK